MNVTRLRRFTASAGPPVLFVAAVVALLASPAAAHRKARVKSVSNPPSIATPKFKLKVKASVKKLTLYASADRRKGGPDVTLAKHARIHHGKVAVTLPPGLAPGAYFVVACPAAKHPKCAASQNITVLLPKSPTTPPNGTPALATTAARAATIGEQGGTLQARAPDGTQFTLSVPARSLPNVTLPYCTFEIQYGLPRRVCHGGTSPSGATVTMTPLTGLSGVSSLGSFAEGVQISPDLAAVRGATLTIKPAHAVAAAQLHAVTYRGTGTGVHEVPLEVSHGQLVVGLGGLGGVAIMRRGSAKAGTRTAREVARGRSAGGASSGEAAHGAFYEQLVAGLVSERREGAISSDDFNSAASSTLDAWHDEIIANEVPAGLNDDAAADIAIRDLVEWARTREQFGLSPEEVFPDLIKLLTGVYNRAQQSCAQQHDLSRVYDIERTFRYLLLVGYPANDFPMDEVFACYRFKVSFDSTITEVHGGQNHGTNTNQYTAEIPIKIDSTRHEPGNPLTGQATGSYAQASGQMYSDPFECGSGGTYVSHADELSGTGVTAEVKEFTLPAHRTGGASPQLQLQLNQPYETYHFYNTGCDNAAATRPVPKWWNLFLDVHRAEIDGTGGGSGFLFKLNPGSGATIATRSYSVTFAAGDDTDTEHTVITVTHTPGHFRKL